MGLKSSLKHAWNRGMKAVSHAAKSITRGFKHAAHAVGVFTRKALKNPFIRIAAIAALSLFAAPLAASMVAGTGLFAAGGLAATVAEGALAGGGVGGLLSGIEGKSIGRGIAVGGITGAATGGLKYALTPAKVAAGAAGSAGNTTVGAATAPTPIGASGNMVAGGDAASTLAAANSPAGQAAASDFAAGMADQPAALVPRVAGDIASTTANNAAATPWYNPSGWSANTTKLVGDVAMGSAKGYFTGAAADKQAQIDQQQIAINQRSEARRAAYDQARSGAGLNLLPQYMTQQATTAQAGQGVNQQWPINQRGLLSLSLDPNAQYQQGMV